MKLKSRSCVEAYRVWQGECLQVLALTQEDSKNLENFCYFTESAKNIRMHGLMWLRI